MLSFFCSNLRQAGIKSFGEFDSLPWKCVSLFVELACTLTSYRTTFLRYCLPDSSPLHFHNPETASRVTLAMLGTVFQTDQKTTKQLNDINNKATTRQPFSMVMNRIPQKILFPLGGDWNKKRRAINALLHFL